MQVNRKFRLVAALGAATVAIGLGITALPAKSQAASTDDAAAEADCQCLRNSQRSTALSAS